MTNGIDIDRYHCEHTRDGAFLYRKVSLTSDGRDFISRIISIAQSIEAKRKESVASDGSTSENEEGGIPDESDVDFSKDIEKNEELQSFLREIRSGKMSEESDLREQLYIWDFGGQYVFYATHTMFHCSRAIYLLVFDLSRKLEDNIKDELFPTETGDKTMEYFIKFWMNSIHAFVGSSDASHPPVILVGTHKDKLEGDDEIKRKTASAYFNKVRELFDDTDVHNHIQIDDFAIDNTSPNDEEIINLRKLIIIIGKRKEFKAEIPAKWIPLEKSLNKLTHENIITFDEVKEIDAKNEFSLGDEEQIKLFLQYHHIKGTLVYFDEDPISGHIVLNPQYLVDAFKCIITSQRFCNNDPTIRPLWKKLMNNARLETGLIEHQWSQNKDKSFLENQDILLAFLKKHCIISEAMAFDENSYTSSGLGWFVVPSLLKHHCSPTLIDDFLNGKKQSLIRLAFRFGNSSVIPTVFHRLVAASLGKWSVVTFKRKHLLFENLAVLRLDIEHVGLIEMDLPEMTIELVLVGLIGKVTLGDFFRRFTESLCKHELGRQPRYKGEYIKPYSFGYRCNHESHGQEKCRLMDISDLKDRKEVPCEDYGNHKIQVHEAKSEWFLPDDIETTNIPCNKLSDKDIGKVSQALGKNWEFLALTLGVTQVQIDNLKQDNHSTVMTIYEMLRLWHRQTGERATLHSLVEACQSVPTLTVDWDEFRNIIDEMQSELITHF
ncbi:probable serine/threonine-protein kinase pats1 [Mercenaria mercenaria]|uniref:probable serine/threonine-protein kinase pats1 n=1 Tax=Mercenaria mercenaria TaxID=6596 RepID=UPI00234EAA58|nr:probable serine/threonine-protein kinase pats1 [Mercenaria mercenaria]